MKGMSTDRETHARETKDAWRRGSNGEASMHELLGSLNHLGGAFSFFGTNYSIKLVMKETVRNWQHGHTYDEVVTIPRDVAWKKGESLGAKLTAIRRQDTWDRLTDDLGRAYFSQSSREALTELQTLQTEIENDPKKKATLTLELK